MSNNRSKVPPMTPGTLVLYILVVIAIGLFFFFVRGDEASKLCACTFCPILILYLIYAFFKEKKADKKADAKNKKIIDGNYFSGLDWQGQYTAYRNEHPFEKPQKTNMKQDLLARFRRKEYFAGMLFSLMLLLGTSCCFMIGNPHVGVVGVLLFGLFFYWEFALYIGMPVRKWLKNVDNYNEVESSYLHSQILTYKKSGLAFGSSYIHAFTEKKVSAIEYKFVERISRKVVRLKKYEDGIYSSEEYQHFAVIHAHAPQSETIQDIEIELNEFQVQMAIDSLQIYKFGQTAVGNMVVEEKEDNMVV